MKIVLLRHGQPDVANMGKIMALEIPEWVELYDTAKLKEQSIPSKQAVDMAKSCNRVVCSYLPRSIESANKLGVNKIDYIEEVFRETELPYIPLPLLKLLPNTWTVIFRILWFCGLSAGGESLADAKSRASTGAKKLIEIAEKNDSVIFVGHGFMNRFIAKELLLKGWKGSVNPGKGYWAFSVYEYKD